MNGVSTVPLIATVEETVITEVINLRLLHCAFVNTDGAVFIVKQADRLMQLGKSCV